MKYWNKARIKRRSEREKRAQERAVAKYRAAQEAARTFSQGDARKNTALIFEALGVKVRRLMVSRLKNGGAMSLSKLVDHFGIALPAAMAHPHILERVGLVETHKQGRVRMCVYRKAALKELSEFLVSNTFRLD